MTREQQIRAIVLKHYPDASISLLTGDASFRKYYRICTAHSSYICMDSDPTLEHNQQFLNAQHILATHQIKVPHIHHMYQDIGIFIIDDFGDTHLESVLLQSPQQIKAHYQSAVDTLIAIQQIAPYHSLGIPYYNASRLTSEMDLAKQWYYPNFNYQHIYAFILNEVSQHPQVLVHRDYHCRNLMLINPSSLGVIDFQDMVIGSYVYDLVSLLKDVYIQLDTSLITELLRYYHQHSTHTLSISFDRLVKDFDLIGVQRHIKILGIFNRLSQRDGKSQYLNHIPLTKTYLLQMAQRYSELSTLKQLCTH